MNNIGTFIMVCYNNLDIDEWSLKGNTVQVLHWFWRWPFSRFHCESEIEKANEENMKVKGQKRRRQEADEK